jgi:hypothetical protein
MSHTVEAKSADVSDVKASQMQTISALSVDETERLGTEIVAALKTVFDPEIPADTRLISRMIAASVSR